MPELPEITVLARQMKQALAGKKLAGVEVLQPKCLNLPEPAFVEALVGAQWLDVTQRGKWLVSETSRGFLLLSLGMGGEILLCTRDSLPEKRRLVLDLDYDAPLRNGASLRNGACVAINFWWFGYAHYVPPAELGSHKMIAKLGPNALDVSAGDLKAMLGGRRGAIKTFLLDQSKLAGIGNFYVHDILFRAGMHPLRTIDTLAEAEIEQLAGAIRDGLQLAVDKGGSFYEVDLYGQKGHFTMDDVLVGYKEGQPCPACRTPIEKVKTGSTSSFICPRCQPL